MSGERLARERGVRHDGPPEEPSHHKEQPVRQDAPSASLRVQMSFLPLIFLERPGEICASFLGNHDGVKALLGSGMYR